jgi:hypothetical protein
MQPTARLFCMTVATLALAACGDGSKPATGTGPVASSVARTPAATELDGEFEIVGSSPGEAGITLRLHDVARVMDNAATIRVKGRGTPAIDAAAGTLAAIRVYPGTPDADRVLDGCGGGCTLDAVIMTRVPDEWLLKTLRGVTPHPRPASMDVGRDDPRRDALLDALRPSIETDLGQSLIFEVDTLRESDGSAFAVVRPRTPAGKPIDFANTRHAQRLEDDVLDGDTVYAILQYRDGRWQVREYAVGPTDVAWTRWAQDYSAPEAIFPTGQ